MTEVFAISFIAFILLLWFKTEVWYEYTKLVGLNRLSKADQYDEEKMNDVTLTYIQFLQKKYRQHFMVRGITCPICISFWVSFFVGLWMGHLVIIPFLAICGLVLYRIVCKLLDI
jgi:hypothetical protein